MFCFKCGATMPDTVTACPQCGAPVQNVASPPPAASPAPTPTSASSSMSPRMSAPLTPAGYGEEPKTDGKATASMILGILSVTCLGLLAGIPAIILGHMSKSSIAKSMGRLKGDGLAMAGLIMGYISVAVIPIILIIAAIAIPSLLRSRMAANTSAAASSIRTLNTAEITYLTVYPDAGYSKSLVALGPGQPPVDCTNSSNVTAEHACLVDAVLGCASAAGCVKYGYRFSLTGICGDGGPCSDYLITARPIDSNTGTKSFCSTNDGVIRYQSGPPFTAMPDTAEECRAWPALE
jgi:type IV pilus assembly protein PilA